MKKGISLLSDSEYKAADKKFNDLKQELNEVEKEIDRLHGVLQSEGKTDFWTDEAERYLREEKTPTIKQSSAREQVLELYNKRTVLNRAIQIQDKKLSAIRANVSARICKGLRPEYASIIAEMAEAAKKLDVVLEKEHQFRDELKQADLAFSGHIHPVIYRGPGRLSDENSHASRFFKEAKEENYI